MRHQTPAAGSRDRATRRGRVRARTARAWHLARATVRAVAAATRDALQAPATPAPAPTAAAERDRVPAPVDHGPAARGLAPVHASAGRELERSTPRTRHARSVPADGASCGPVPARGCDRDGTGPGPADRTIVRLSLVERLFGPIERVFEGRTGVRLVPPRGVGTDVGTNRRPA